VPFLTSLSAAGISDHPYLQGIPSFNNGIQLNLQKNVTFFVGENGSGKSTLLEGIAERCEFSLRGGNRNHNHNIGHRFVGYESAMAPYLQLSWNPRRISEGFFMRAESFFNFASYIDELAKDDSRILNAYGGKSLHAQSHGESFLSLFNNQFESGIYILDEPEAALSPARILAFMAVINQLESSGRAQFLIATHSPILICYPGAAIFQFDENGIHETDYESTEHFSLTKSFLDNPKLFLRHLINESL
jgi:predicted ATPase